MYLIVNKQPVKYQGEVTDWTRPFPKNTNGKINKQQTFLVVSWALRGPHLY